MYRIVFTLFMALACGSVLADEKIPFAYYKSQLGTTLLYKNDCPIPNPNGWKESRQIFRVRGWMTTCWSKDFNPQFQQEIVTLCTTKQKNGVEIVDLGGGCQFVSANKFIKGNPIPDRAF